MFGMQMFGKERKTETYRATRDDMKAMRGRHARLDGARAAGPRAQTLSAKQALAPDEAPASAPLPAVRAVSRKDLERMFEKFFRMGAAVATGELFDEGMLDAASLFEIRGFLESFDICSMEEIRALGVSGPYLEDFACIFSGAEEFPPAA